MDLYFILFIGICGGPEKGRLGFLGWRGLAA